MREIAPIKTSGLHQTDDEVRKHHAQIEARLEELGRERVGIMMVTGGLPTEWHVIANAWLAGDRLQRDGDDQGRR